MKTLHIFDMDGTLYSGWKGWNEPVVAAAKKSAQNPLVHSVLLTGRPDALMRGTTLLQLRERHLGFHEIRLAPFGVLAVPAYKREELKRLLRSVHPKHVVIWDDREDNLMAMGALLVEAGITHELNMVAM
jgi:FMN phosphatase YigB (HAD superfamily)